MYRFLLSPKWLAFHAVCLVGIITMVNLCFWQLGRLDERKDFNAEVVAVVDQDPVPLGDLVPDPGTDASDFEWVPVVATGTYLPSQVVWFNRSQEGQAGDNVLTPLVLHNGNIVLVNRGFITPPGAVPPAPPEGEIQVLGRIRPSQSDQTSELSEAETEDDIQVRSVEIGRIAHELPGPVLPVYLDLIASEPAVGSGDPAPIPAPEVDNGPHLSYAIQWLIFALCVAIGWVFAVRASVRKHRATASRDDAGDDDSRAPTESSTVAAGSPSSSAGTEPPVPSRTPPPSPN